VACRIRRKRDKEVLLKKKKKERKKEREKETVPRKLYRIKEEGRGSPEKKTVIE
jgi:hypothetical protein